MLRKQLEDFRNGIKEPENIKVETEWRRAGEEMCGHVGINPNPKTFMKWIMDRYEAPKATITMTNPTLATEFTHNQALNQTFYNTVTAGNWAVYAPAEQVAIAN